MVRINIISPHKLADQHLLAEHNEILMLIGHTKKFPKLTKCPDKYCLGDGHIHFFKNKLKYLKNRHELIRKEMKKRGFQSKKTINLPKYLKKYNNDWKPSKEDEKIIKERITHKIKLKPEYYRYYGEHKPAKFFIKLLHK